MINKNIKYVLCGVVTAFVLKNVYDVKDVYSGIEEIILWTLLGFITVCAAIDNTRKNK